MPQYDRTSNEFERNAIQKKAEKEGLHVGVIITHHLSRANKPYTVRRLGFIDENGVYAIPYVNRRGAVTLYDRKSWIYREQEPVIAV